MSNSGQRVFPFALAACVLLLDRITKGMIKASFSVWDTPRAVIPGFFNIAHTENPGIAFGLLADNSSSWRAIFLIGFSIAVLLVISTVLLKPNSVAVHSRLLRTGLALILGGAFGNLYDRIVNGTVTDFIEVHAGQYYFPDFNVADSAIFIGACLLLLDMWHGRQSKSQPVEAAR
jgi:signal peptidase II